MALRGITKNPNLGLIAGLGPGFSNLQDAIARQFGGNAIQSVGLLGPGNTIRTPEIARILGLPEFQTFPDLMLALSRISLQEGFEDRIFSRLPGLSGTF